MTLLLKNKIVFFFNFIYYCINTEDMYIIKKKKKKIKLHEMRIKNNNNQ